MLLYNEMYLYKLNECFRFLREMKRNKISNDKTERAMLRDRISSGMRYFSKNVGEDGKVHIAFSDYVNMDALFKEYFEHKGNGPFKKMYEDEFLHFVIDR